MCWTLPANAESDGLSPVERGWTIGVRAAVAGDSHGGQSASGSVELTVPLDSSASPKPTADRSVPLTGRGDSELLTEGEVPQARVATAGGSGPSDSGLRLEALRSGFARRLVRACLRAAGFNRAGPRLRSMASRSRYSAAFPELRLRAGRSTDESVRVAPTVADPDRYTRSGGADYWLEGRLNWRLDRLVFARPELAIERLRESRRQSELRLTREVLKVLFEWYGARLQLVREDLLPEERWGPSLKLAEAQATLEVLSAGWFDAEKAPGGPAAVIRAHKMSHGGQILPSTRPETPKKP